MSKYDELKQRIEAVTGWDKIADDLLYELFMHAEQHYRLIIPFTRQNNDHIFIVEYSSGSGKFIKTVAEFIFLSQCEKLKAFKQALLWLLDHSNIKKDEKKEEIAQIKEEMKKLQERLEKLE